MFLKIKTGFQHSAPHFSHKVEPHSSLCEKEKQVCIFYIMKERSVQFTRVHEKMQLCKQINTIQYINIIQVMLIELLLIL